MIGNILKLLKILSLYFYLKYKKWLILPHTPLSQLQTLCLNVNEISCCTHLNDSFV